MLGYFISLMLAVSLAYGEGDSERIKPQIQVNKICSIKAKKRKKKKKPRLPSQQNANAQQQPFQYNPEIPRPSSFYDPLVDYYLKNKIILCTGPALGRYEMLKRSTEDDLKLIPFKKIFITTNEPTIPGITFEQGKVIPSQCYLIPDRGKQVDCTNCIISTLRHAVNDPDVLDDDIILFKHESLYINDMELINRAIDKIVNEGYNMVTRDRLPTPEVRLPTSAGGTCTDAFFVRTSAIRKIVENYSDITELPPHQWCCELYVWGNIVNHISDVYRVFYCHNNGGPTELGFYHYPTNRDPFWDRSNYHELYKY